MLDTLNFGPRSALCSLEHGLNVSGNLQYKWKLHSTVSWKYIYWFEARAKKKCLQITLNIYYYNSNGSWQATETGGSLDKQGLPTMLNQWLLTFLPIINHRFAAKSNFCLGSYSHHVFLITYTLIYNKKLMSKWPWVDYGHGLPVAYVGFTEPFIGQSQVRSF